MIRSLPFAVAIVLTTWVAGPTLAESAQAPKLGTLTVRLAGIKSEQGQVRVALFATEKGYNDDKAVAGQFVSVPYTKAGIEFEGLAPGDYALKVFHDLNSNGSLDTNLVGIPTEPYGFSQDARGNFGPPSWQDAHFTVRLGSNSQTVTLK